MTTPIIRTVETAIVTQLGTISWLQTGGSADPSRVRGIADVQTAMGFLGVVAPAALVQYRGETIAGAPNRTGTIGRPIQEDFWLTWWVYLIATNFTPLTESPDIVTTSGYAASIGAYQEIDDVFLALQGFNVRPGSDSFLMYQGDSYQTITANNQVVHISKWAHRTRRVGTIAS